MANPVAIVEKIVRIGLAIKDAVNTVRQNEEQCQEIRRRVLRFSAILSQLQQSGMMDNNNQAISGPLEDLEETLNHALQLVTTCQEERSTTICRLFRAGDLSKKLRRVKDDILNKVMLASFAINSQATIVLLTVHGGRHPPPLQQPEETRVIETLHNSPSIVDIARPESNSEQNNILEGSKMPIAPSVGLTEFRPSELKISSNNRLGCGGFSSVYKGVLNDGNVVAIKEIFEGPYSSWEDIYDILLIVSTLQHRNIVRVLGYVTHEVQSLSLVGLLKRKDTRDMKRVHHLVEEYLPNGSLHKIIHESRLDWSSLFRIIEGVAQGLHCLHKHSIIHLNINPSNILLDSYMNPKIIDFRSSEVLLDDNKSTDGEYRVRGRIGYVDPQSWEGNIMSMKNDVYAFGITLLETVGGIRRSKPPGEYPLYHRWAWEVWEAGRTEEEFDPSSFDESQLVEIRRCIQIGLLCSQHERADRPTMAEVLEMLHGKKELPTPKKPRYLEQEEGSASSPAPSVGSLNSPSYSRTKETTLACTTE